MKKEQYEDILHKGDFCNLQPYIKSIQKMVLYETKTKFFLVGSNQRETKFRILKIDRTEPRELCLVEDQARYTAKEMKDLLGTIASVNRQKVNPYGGLVRTVSAFGVLGFVKFLEGYYIVLITKRRKIANIGFHAVYKIEETSCIYIPFENNPSKNPDEIRYLKLFLSIDLSSNFYFTYCYDLSNSLQYNMAKPMNVIPGYNIPNPDAYFEYEGYGTINKVNRKFVWNSHLLEPMEGHLHPDWVIYVIHGFIGQSNICVYGKSIYLTLIARRSSYYAGTRFLKRGSNCQGDVANELETEQIVFDASVCSFKKGKFTSFVQMRGSIPAYWSQDISKMVPKPDIGIDLADPFAEVPGKHFSKLLKRFGSPIVVINLVKKRERKRHESILTEEYTTSIKTLNQFLPNAFKIHYVGFDMARINKMKDSNVLAKLAAISEDVFKKTGFFQSNFPIDQNGHGEFNSGKQTGIIRINCVDCLDRTNTAQFVLGKCALSYQLRALGVCSQSELEFETDIIRMLEELYEDHGDTLALQYGGSQLVHRINTYRKTAAWTSQGNDIMQTLSRYYSNTFSDADKQNAINLFLGVYRPYDEVIPLWSLESDLHLHFKQEFRFTNKSRESIKPLTEWFSDEILETLPYSLYEKVKTCLIIPFEDAQDVDLYADFYRLSQVALLSDIFAFKINNSIRDYMPNFTTDFSPFSVRQRQGKRHEENTKGKKSLQNKIISFKNPSILGLSSSSNASSTNSTSSDTEYSSSEEMCSSMASSNVQGSQNNTNGRNSPGNSLLFQKFFPTMKESYGVEIKSPKKSDIVLYKRFVNLQQLKDTPINTLSKIVNHTSIPLSGFSKDSSFKVTPPTVSRKSREVCTNYVLKGKVGASMPGSRDMSIYKRYVEKSGNPFHL